MAQKMQSKYAVVELNNVASVRTGKIISQYNMAADVSELENGMLVEVDHYKQEIKLPSADNTASNLYLHASVEKIYDGKGRNEFVVKKGEFLPRLYKLHVGDTFETNCVEEPKDGNMVELAKIITDSKGYGFCKRNGLISLQEDQANLGTSKLALKALGIVTLPNGENGIKWRVIKAEV